MKAVGMTGKTQPAEQQLQATQPADAPSGTGLKKQTASRWPVLQQKQQLPQMTSACRAGKWGECDGTGTQKGGLRPTYLSLPHLMPLPVTVPTHSLNFEKPNLAPLNFFFVFLFLSLTPPL